MSSIVDDFRRDEVRVLDRLVDGELSAAEERELLAALDDEPGAWRRCALAFLESRALGSDLNMARSAVLEVTLPAKKPAKANVRAMVLVSAASVVVSFGVGLKLRGFDWPFSSGAPQVATVEPLPPQQPSVPVNPASPNSVPSNSVPSNSTPSNRAPVHLVDAHGAKVNSTPGKWETFKLNLGEGSEEIDVPAVEMAAVDPAWLENQGSAVPADVIEYIERTGHEVRRQRTLLPIDLKDGRQLIVPVEQLELEYVGGSKYQ